MGHLYSDGKAVDVNDAGSAAVNFGDLYRIGGITGIAMKTLLTTDTVRDLALETSERVWKVKVPAGFAGAAGTYVFWTTGAGRKDGAVDLTSTAPASPNDRPIGVVVVAKNANGYAAIKMLLAGPGIA